MQNVLPWRLWQTAHADLDTEELCQRYLVWCVLFKPYSCLFFVHVFKIQSVLSILQKTQLYLML